MGLFFTVCICLFQRCQGRSKRAFCHSGQQRVSQPPKKVSRSEEMVQETVEKTARETVEEIVRAETAEETEEEIF